MKNLARTMLIALPFASNALGADGPTAVSDEHIQTLAHSLVAHCVATVTSDAAPDPEAFEPAFEATKSKNKRELSFESRAPLEKVFLTVRIGKKERGCTLLATGVVAPVARILSGLIAEFVKLPNVTAGEIPSVSGRLAPMKMWRSDVENQIPVMLGGSIDDQFMLVVIQAAKKAP